MGMKTTFRDYIRGFPSFFKAIRDIVNPSSISRLQLVSDTLNDLSDQDGRNIKWEIRIPRTDPLKFKEFIRNGYRLEVQLNCEIKGTAPSLDSNEVTIDEYKVEIWIRSLDKDLSFRPDFDSKKICQQLSKRDWRRVILSYHMDRRGASAKVFEPIYHLHAGGRLAEQEYCWIPKDLEEPRFYFFPLDIILLCEFILVNFEPEKHDELRKTPEWRNQVIRSQNLYLKPYISKFYKYLEDNNYTLLNHLTKCY
jgi:hypothetical protein